jgi:hypothetical protein
MCGFFERQCMGLAARRTCPRLELCRWCDAHAPPCSLQGPARHLQRRVEGLLMTAGDGVLPFKVQMAADGQIRNSVSRGSGKSNRETLTHSVDFCCKFRTHRQCVCINSLNVTWHFGAIGKTHSLKKFALFFVRPYSIPFPDWKCLKPVAPWKCWSQLAVPLCRETFQLWTSLEPMRKIQWKAVLRALALKPSHSFGS